MRTIYKYPIRLEDVGVDNSATIELPIEHRFVEAAMQPTMPKEKDDGWRLCFWALVDTDTPVVKTRLFIFGTGHDMSGLPDTCDYLSCVHDPRGFVWHVFIDNVPQLEGN